MVISTMIEEILFSLCQKKERALNAGCMINHYEPVTLDELIKNNQEYKKRGE